jgi:hypothetical protein
MELSPSGQANSCAATQELLKLLRLPKDQCCVHESPQLMPVLSQIIPIQTTSFYLRCVFILRSQLCTVPPICLFSSRFLTKTL